MTAIDSRESKGREVCPPKDDPSQSGPSFRRRGCTTSRRIAPFTNGVTHRPPPRIGSPGRIEDSTWFMSRWPGTGSPCSRRSASTRTAREHQHGRSLGTGIARFVNHGPRRKASGTSSIHRPVLFLFQLDGKKKIQGIAYTIEESLILGKWIGAPEIANIIRIKTPPRPSSRRRGRLACGLLGEFLLAEGDGS